MAYVEDYVPGVDKGVGTPVAATCEDGILGDNGFGWRAPMLMSGILGVRPKWKGAEGYDEV